MNSLTILKSCKLVRNKVGLLCDLVIGLCWNMLAWLMVFHRWFGLFHGIIFCPCWIGLFHGLMVFQGSFSFFHEFIFTLVCWITLFHGIMICICILQDKFVSLVIELPQLDVFLCFMIYQGWKDLFHEFMN